MLSEDELKRLLDLVEPFLLEAERLGLSKETIHAFIDSIGPPPKPRRRKVKRSGSLRKRTR